MRPSGSDPALASSVAAMRGFNRFYTGAIGVLDEHHLHSALSLAEVRVLYELAHAGASVPPSARTLAAALGLDEGYLSRILQRFAQRGWLRRSRDNADRRRSRLVLTGRGRAALAPLEARSRQRGASMLGPLEPDERADLVEAMRTIQRLLGARPEAASTAVTLRAPAPGDLGWIVHRHGALYAREYGYDMGFEALVARIAADYVQKLDSARECCWIAERAGAIAGSVFLVRKSATVAKLRLLYVEPWARGSGTGSRLVDACIEFARRAGYRRIVLWTQSELIAARRLYARAGFERVAEEPHHSFGRDLVAETWTKRL
jgi:DNA-binding MarR family transcriptional regulator/N-acetylglutamate synthase-like GNAT family acetyltransferase